MNLVKKYNIFILISTLSRNVFEILSSLFLYKMGYSLKEILIYYFILYFVGIFVNILCLNLVKYINGKWILIFSSLLFGFTFYYLNNMVSNTNNLIILAILFSVSSYSYHSMRHYLALNVLPNNKKVNVFNILIPIYLAMIFAPYIGAFLTNRYGLYYTMLFSMIFSILGILPIINLKINNKLDNYSLKETIKDINKSKYCFFILEQFKVIFLSLQPLYLFLNISNNLEYIGVFNIIFGIASIICAYFVIKKINIYAYFKYLNIVFVLILLLKININDKYYILLIAFLEGLFIKIYETVSLNNIYTVNNKNIINYLIVCEIIFCLVRTIICLICATINDFKLILYFMIIGIFLSGFVKIIKNN